MLGVFASLTWMLDVWFCATIRRQSHPTKNARRVVRKAIGRRGVLIQD